MVRRALAIAAAAQYLRIAVRLASMAVVVRLLTPTEVGVAVIGTAIMTIALGLREFASSEFLIQRHEIGRDDIRTSFTLVFTTTALMTVATFVLAPWVGGLYGEEKLASFLRITAVAGLIEAVSLPILECCGATWRSAPSRASKPRAQQSPPWRPLGSRSLASAT